MKILVTGKNGQLGRSINKIINTNSKLCNNQNLNEFISNYDGFSSLKLISKTEVEFQYKDGSTKVFKFN